MPDPRELEAGDSFAAFVAARDVECPDCGYNLRGLQGKRCPECGAAVGWGAFAAWGPRSEPRLFRAAEAGLITGAVLAFGILALRAWPAAMSGQAAPMVATIGVPMVSILATGLWLRRRRQVARWPRRDQGRAATLAWVLAAVLAIVAMGGSV